MIVIMAKLFQPQQRSLRGCLRVCKALPHSFEACFGDVGLVFRGEEIWATQNLCVHVQDSKDM